MKKINWLNYIIVAVIALGATLSVATNSIAGDKEKSAKAEFIIQVASAKGEAEKGAFMGIYPAEIGDEDREALDFKGDGVLIHDVVEDGPSDKAGLESGDIIIELDGVKLKSLKDLRKVLSKSEADNKIKVIVMRDGKKEKFKVKLTGKPASLFASSEIKKTVTFLGVETQEISDQLSEYFKVSSGVLITKVVEESAAEKAGLKAGDVIIKLAGHDIDDTGELGEIIRDQESDQDVKINIKRDGKDKEITAKLGEKTYTSNVGGFGGRNFNFDFDFDDGDFHFDTESIQKIIRKALRKADMELSDDDQEEVRREMEEFKKEMIEMRKEMMKMKEEMKDSKK